MNDLTKSSLLSFVVLWLLLGVAAYFKLPDRIIVWTQTIENRSN
jgi:hypothetical protein